MATDNIRIQPYLPPALYQRLESHKEHTGRSISQIVITALESYLDRTGPTATQLEEAHPLPISPDAGQEILNRLNRLESSLAVLDNFVGTIARQVTALSEESLNTSLRVTTFPSSLPSDEPVDAEELPSELPELPSESPEESMDELPIVKFLKTNGESPKELPSESPQESPIEETPQIEEKPQSKVHQPLYLGKGLPYTLARKDLNYLTNIAGLCPVAASDEQFCNRMEVAPSTLEKKKRLSPLQQAKWSQKKDAQSVFWIWDKSINYWVGRPACEFDEIDWSKM